MQRDRETKAAKVKKTQASYLDATGFRDRLSLFEVYSGLFFGRNSVIKVELAKH